MPSRNSVATVSNGRVGHTASFSGSQFAEIPFSELLNTDEFSVSIWANRSSGTDHASPFSSRQLTIAGSTIRKGYVLYSVNNEFQFFTGNGTGWHADTTSSHALNTWYLVTLTYDGSTKKIWSDGILVSTAPSSVDYQKNQTHNLRIGAGTNEDVNADHYWNGMLDEMRFASVEALLIGSKQSMTTRRMSRVWLTMVRYRVRVSLPLHSQQQVTLVVLFPIP